MKIIPFLTKFLILKFEDSSFWGALMAEISERACFFDLYIFKCSELKPHVFNSKTRGDMIENP